LKYKPDSTLNVEICIINAPMFNIIKFNHNLLRFCNSFFAGLISLIIYVALSIIYEQINLSLFTTGMHFVKLLVLIEGASYPGHI